MSYLIAIDPSVNNIGFADLQIPGDAMVFEDCKWSTKLIQPISGNLQERTGYILNRILKLIHNRRSDVDALIMEMPVFMTGVKGLIAAQKGYTLDLAYVIGSIQGMLDVPSSNVHLYRPRDWKGQKPKSATWAQHKRIFGHDVRSQDECDAKMILHFHAKKFALI